MDRIVSMYCNTIESARVAKQRLVFEYFGLKIGQQDIPGTKQRIILHDSMAGLDEDDAALPMDIAERRLERRHRRKMKGNRFHRFVKRWQGSTRLTLPLRG